jgi:hypothetical protein
MSDYAKVLRDDADQFLTTVAVVAEREGEDIGVLAFEALTDALARLGERGILGSSDEDAA